jgi:pimeloyl-ACP methyl ester carboxylesterase
VTTRTIDANGVSLNVLDEGDGHPVLLLHGFPDSSHLWRNQIPALVEAGFRAVAPDQRGFGESDRPDAVDAYALPNMLGDVVAVLDTLDVERVSVVGHDWGAAVAWGTAAFLPDRVDRLVAISVGHPAAFLHAGLEQLEKSWYMLWFQFPGVAESVLPLDGWRFFREWGRNGGDIDKAIEDLARPGALTAGLNWYRANISPEGFGSGEPPPVPPVACPTLGIWSSGDHYLTEAQMVASAQHVTGEWRYERIEDASHWVPVDAPEHLNRLLLGFLVTGA